MKKVEKKVVKKPVKKPTKVPAKRKPKALPKIERDPLTAEVQAAAKLISDGLVARTRATGEKLKAEGKTAVVSEIDAIGPELARVLVCLNDSDFALVLTGRKIEGDKMEGESVFVGGMTTGDTLKIAARLEDMATSLRVQTLRSMISVDKDIPDELKRLILGGGR